MILPELIRTIENQLKKTEDCYLVGGAVRDRILGREIQDFDFVTSIDPRVLACRVADELGAAFFVMDATRFTSRVIYRESSEKQLVMDFSGLQGNLDQDLRARDFTINAMVINLNCPDQIIDPLGGGRDLQGRWLRPCSHESFVNDPVRVIRAARYAAELELKIEPSTARMIEQVVNSLGTVSLERKRDELFKILDCTNGFAAISLLRKFSILPEMELSFDINQSNQYRVYEILELIVSSRKKRKGSDFFVAAAFGSAISSLKNDLAKYFERRNPNGHSNFQVDKFSLLLPEKYDNFLNDSRLLSVLSNDELAVIRILRDYHEITLELLESDEGLEKRTCYRFYKKTGKTGLDLILLCLAEIASKPAAEVEQHKWLAILNKSTILMDSWISHPETTQPKPLVNGDEIMSCFNLQAGPLIGELLERLIEEQAAGIIDQRENALSWIQEQLKNK